MSADTCISERKMKAVLWEPSSLIKRPRVLLTLPLRGHCPVVFLAISLPGRGSKPVTVSFRLQSRAFSSCSGGFGSQLGERKSHPPHLLKLPLSWFTDSRGKPGGCLESSFSTHPLHYKSPVLILTRFPTPPSQIPVTSSHLFLPVVW